MSATPHTDGDVQIHECSHCGGDRRASTSVAGSFCSTSCYREHRRTKLAGEIFELLEHDHRFCATCARQLKTVNKPPRQVVIPPSLHDSDWGNASDVLVGYQHRTEHAETGEISLDVDDEADRPIVEDGVATGTVCCCGVTDHSDVESTIRKREPFTAAHYLARAVRVLREEEKHEVEIDRCALFQAVLEHESHRDALAKAVRLE